MSIITLNPHLNLFFPKYPLPVIFLIPNRIHSLGKLFRIMNIEKIGKGSKKNYFY